MKSSNSSSTTMLASPMQAKVIGAIAERAARPGCRFLEVGSWVGDTTVIWAKVAQKYGGRLYCIDWWNGSADTELDEVAKSRNVFAEFWTRIESEGLQDTVIPVRCRSDVAADVLKAGAFDLVFIDADHRYSSVMQDIAAFKPLVKQGGILCGHDCEGRAEDYSMAFLQQGKERDYFESVHCGVVLAVHESFKDYSINEAIWSVRREEDGEWSATNFPFPSELCGRQGHPPFFGATESYLLYRYGNAIYAAPRYLSNFDCRKPSSTHDSNVLSACTLEDVLSLLNEPLLTDRAPRLEGAYCGFNIVEWQDTYFAIASKAGPIDLTRATPSFIEALRTSGELISSRSLLDIKTQLAILGRMEKLSFELPPDLVSRVVKIVEETRALGQRISIYGAGEHTKLLFDTTPLRASDIFAIFDKNPALYWHELRGVVILPAEKIFEHAPNQILISSPRFEVQIADFLRPLEASGTRIHRLYNMPSLN